VKAETQKPSTYRLGGSHILVRASVITKFARELVIDGRQRRASFLEATDVVGYCFRDAPGQIRRGYMLSVHCKRLDLFFGIVG
jgi:hypothetical protein